MSTVERELAQNHDNEPHVYLRSSELTLNHDNVSE